MPAMKSRAAGFKTLMVNVMTGNLGEPNKYQLLDFKVNWKLTQTSKQMRNHYISFINDKREHYLYLQLSKLIMKDTNNPTKMIHPGVCLELKKFLGYGALSTTPHIQLSWSVLSGGWCTDAPMTTLGLRFESVTYCSS